MSYRDEIKKGETLYQNGEIDEAEAVFSSVLEKYPDNFDAINNLGVIKHSSGDFEKAKEYFIKASTLKENYIDPLLNLADIYQGEKRWEEAAEKLIKCIEIEPDNQDIYNQLGLIYLEMSDTINALKALQKSLVLNSEQDTIKEVFNSLRNQISNELALLKYNKINTQQLEPEKKPVANVNNGEKTAAPISSYSSPLVTVGLPVFNGGELVQQAIESILSQDYHNFELIISDNCSTDNTGEICQSYRKKDNRIKYYRMEENLGAKENFINALRHSNTPYFMWASHDDLREPQFISKCLDKIEEDTSIALVYPKTKVLDKNSILQGIANDHIQADQDNPLERYRHLIWKIGMCNMFFGLFRSSLLKKMRSWDKTLFVDNLMLAELALSGKIVHIDDILYIRRLTRDYDYKSPDERNAQLIRDADSHMFNEGITLPHCRLTYAHLELINNADMKTEEKTFLLNDTIKCFKTRFGPNMEYEINRAIQLINEGHYFYSWDRKQTRSTVPGALDVMDYFHINNLIKHIQEALFIFPEKSDLKEVYKICFTRLSEFGLKTGVSASN